jgi:hypothetical protein
MNPPVNHKLVREVIFAGLQVFCRCLLLSLVQSNLSLQCTIATAPTLRTGKAEAFGKPQLLVCT